MQNYNQNLPYVLSIQHTGTHSPINQVNLVYCIHCERNIHEVVPEPIVVCGDCIKLIANKPSALCAEDDYGNSFNRRTSKL